MFELQAMDINTIYAARFDVTLTFMRTDCIKASDVKEQAVDTSAIGSDEVYIVSDSFGRNDFGSVVR